jgi:hypothetical protein
MHDSVYDIAGDDPRLAKLLRSSLQKLADGPDGPLREMAEGVLNEAIDKFSAYFARLDHEQRDQVVADTQRQLDELLDGPSQLPSPHCQEY